MPNRTMESGVQLFSRTKNNNVQVLNGINPKLFPEGGPFGNQAIEVVFEESIDSTDFFIDIITRAILPSRLDKEFKESQVILLHTDFQVNLFKIIKFIEKKIEPHNININEKRNLIEEALKKLVVLNCYTSEQLEITFHNLERIINNCENPSLVILDNCLSQYWISKFDNMMLSFAEYCLKIISTLYEKIKDLNVTLMYGRACTNDNLKRAAQIGYTIHITKSDLSYVAKITNLETNNRFSVPFHVNVCLEFI